MIKFFRGDSVSLKLDITNEQDAPFDLGGFTAIMTVRTSDDAPSIIFEKVGIEPQSPESEGVIIINLTPQETGTFSVGVLVFDVEVANGGRSLVYTVTKDFLTVEADISR